MTKEKKILKNYLLYFLSLLFICFIGISNVFAITYTDIGYVQHLSGVNGSVTIDVSYETESGAPLPVNRNQTVYTQIKVLNVFIDNYNFLANTQYQIEMEMLNETLQYANTFEVYGNNNELCLVSYTNSDFVGHHYPKFNFQCNTSTSSIYLKVYNSSNNSITDMSNWSWSYMFLRTTTEKIDNNSDSDNIINNQNQNTQNIIANQNQNTQDIINNQNQNTQQEIESQKVCKNYDKNSIVLDNAYLTNNGTINKYNMPWGITDYINITNSTIELLVQTEQSTTSTHFCFYNTNKNLISCVNNANIGNIIIPQNADYVRFTINTEYNKPQFKICTNGNQALNDSIEEQTKTSKGILGKIGDLISYINPLSENFFVYKLIDLLEDLLKRLFVPSSQYLNNWYTDFRQWIEQKLGFLSTPITLFLDFINLYLNLEEGDLIINIPQISVPNFEDNVIIQAQTFNWGQLLRSKPALLNMWNLYLDFIDVFLILNFLGLCEVTYNRIFGGDTTQYEYYTVEDTYSINDETGEATNHQLRQRRTRREKVE